MADTDDRKSPKGRKFEPGELSKMDVLGWWKLGLESGQTLLDEEDDADKEANRILFGTIGDIVQLTLEEVLRYQGYSAGHIERLAPKLTERVIERFAKGEAPYSERKA